MRIAPHWKMEEIYSKQGQNVTNSIKRQFLALLKTFYFPAFLYFGTLERANFFSYSICSWIDVSAL